MPSQVLQSRLQLQPLFVLGDVPAPRIVRRKRLPLEMPVGFSPQAWRRHELRVSGDGIFPRAAKRVLAREQLFPAARRHGRLLPAVELSRLTYKGRPKTGARPESEVKLGCSHPADDSD